MGGRRAKGEGAASSLIFWEKREKKGRPRPSLTADIKGKTASLRVRPKALGKENDREEARCREDHFIFDGELERGGEGEEFCLSDRKEKARRAKVTEKKRRNLKALYACKGLREERNEEESRFHLREL